MTKSDTILVVIDPTAKEHPALDRATDVAVKIGASVELLICDYQPHIIGATFLDSKRLQNAKKNYLGQHLKNLTSLAQKGRDGGIDIRVKAVWDRPLYEGIIRQALKAEFQEPSTLAARASVPKAELWWPVVLAVRASAPKAEL